MNPMDVCFANALEFSDTMVSGLWAFALGGVLTILVGGFLLQGVSFLLERLSLSRRLDRDMARRSRRDRQ